MVERLICGIDVGTTKICTLVGRVGDNKVLNVVGVGVVPARGIHRGVVTDIEEATSCIGESVRKAQQVSGYTVSEVYLSVGGSHIASQNSRGVAAIGRGDRPVDRDDIRRAVDAAQAVAVPHNRRVLHVLPREYIIDDRGGIKKPLGMMGFRLEVETHIVTASESCIQNLVNCVRRHQIDVLDLVLQPLASAEATLTEEEKRMGVVLVDIGGGTTDLAVFVNGSVWQTQVFDVGGWNITRDIGVMLRTPSSVAESAKVRYGHAQPDSVPQNEMIELQVFGAHNVASLPRRKLCQIVHARVNEMLGQIQEAIRKLGFGPLLSAGIVMTGGVAELRGLRDMAEEKLHMPVRTASPQRLHGLVEAVNSPAYSTAVGLLLWGMRETHSRVDAPADRGWFRTVLDQLLPDR